MFWPVPRNVFAADQTVYIIGGGPSLNLSYMVLSRIPPASIIAINDACADFAPLAEFHFWADRRWYEASAWAMPRRPRFRVCTHVDPPDGAHRMRYHRDKMPLSDAQDTLTGDDGGSRALNLAYLAGARDIVLVGFDMRDNDPRGRNYHDGYGFGDDDLPLSRFIPAHVAMAEALASRGIRVRNASPGSALPCYPIVRLEDTL